MVHTTPVRRFKWYHAALIVLFVLVLACVGFSTVISTSPLVRQAAQGLGNEFIKVSEVRQKIADKFGLNVADVGVQINFSTFRNTQRETNQVRTLVITLVNTTFNDIPSMQRKATLATVAAFAHDNYDDSSPVDNYCVVLVTKKAFLFFTSASNYTVCFSADEL